MAQQQTLGLGGHSFIEQLGNDPAASFEEQCGIVAACTANGIRLVDTTYYQERVALGHVMQKLNNRSEVRVMAWNFFKPDDESKLPGPTPFEPEHIGIMLQELQTDYIDILVVHINNDRDRFQQELNLVKRWIAEGKVKEAAIGMAKPEHVEQLPVDHPVSYVLAPFNAFNRSALETFGLARSKGLRCIALSPFFRGWKLDEIGGDKAKTAEILLRWVVQHDIVDSVIVSMRRSDYVRTNLDAARLGALNTEETALLDTWAADR